MSDSILMTDIFSHCDSQQHTPSVEHPPPHILQIFVLILDVQTFIVNWIHKPLTFIISRSDIFRQHADLKLTFIGFLKQKIFCDKVHLVALYP